MAVRLIITGGTFDKRYDEIKGKLTLDQTHLPEILDLVRCKLDIQLEINQLIDSLYMEEEGRQSILESCKNAPEDRIVVTHGTDTMAKTAAVLGQAGLDKTIVLTGAMRPYSVGKSDATFNLGSALIATQTLPAGVYIAMNGKIFTWDNVEKNRELGIFETLD